MSKNLSIQPRKPVNEAVLRQLEEAAERKSQAVAGEPSSLSTVPANETHEAPVAPRVVQEAPAPVPQVAPVAAEPEPSIAALEPAPATALAPSKPSIVRPKGESQVRRKVEVELPTTGVGTRANPYIRKFDGVKTRSTSVHLPIEVALRLTMFCAREGRRQSEVMTQSVIDFLEYYDR